VDSHRVVEVLGSRTGSGLLLADRLVLTAAHLLFPDDGDPLHEHAIANATVAVRLAGGEYRFAARCVWARYQGPHHGLDAALLEITSPGWTPPAVEAVRLGRLAGSAEARVHAFGFPDAAFRAGRPELSPVTGTVHTGSGRDSGRPEIVVDGPPEQLPGGKSWWAGLSGGPVFAAPSGVTEDVLLGVIVSAPTQFGGRRLQMIPMPAVLAGGASAFVKRPTVISLPGREKSAQPEVRYSLPPDTAAFTGRGPELNEIIAAVSSAAESGGAVTVRTIGGMPGMGKTALAVHAAHLLSDRFPDRQLFIDLLAYTPDRKPLAPRDALAGLLTAVGLDPRVIPNHLDGRAALWRDRLAGQQTLLILDNADSTAQVTPLLPGGGNCLVLVTSRRHMGDLPGAVVPVLLDVLPAEQAQTMFTRLAPRAVGDPHGVAEVARLAGFLPLAVSLLARVYACHPSWTLADLATETRQRLLTLTAEHATIAAAFEVSYRHQDRARQRFFCLLGLYPGTTIDNYAAAALAGVSPPEAEGLLDALHREGLLTETGHRRYTMHDLLRRYARDRAAADLGLDPELALGRLLDYYQHTGAVADDRLARQSRPGPRGPASAMSAASPPLEDAGQALAWARAERDSLLTCLDHATQAGQHARVTALTAAVAGLLRIDGPWAEAVNRHTAALLSAGHLGDRLAQANALNSLGVVRRLTADYQDALADLEEALAIYRGLGARLGQANALSNLGIVRWMTGDYQDALGDSEQALAIYRALGDRLGQANALMCLGCVRQLTGDSQGAGTDLEEALALCRVLGDRLGQANALLYLGTMRQRTGDYQGAGAALEQSLAIHRDLSNPIGQLASLTYLGTNRRLEGKYHDALPYLDEALAMCRNFGERGAEAGVLNEIGTLYQVSGKPNEGKAHHSQALELALAIGNAPFRADALAGLGRCATALGDEIQAKTLLRQAYEIFRVIGAVEASAVLAELDDLDQARARGQTR
jgi:tetratricopeptide (TPR) repeat protein